MATTGHSSFASHGQKIVYQALEPEPSVRSPGSIWDDESKSEISFKEQRYLYDIKTGRSQRRLILQLILSAIFGVVITIIGYQMLESTGLSRHVRVKEFAPEMPLATITFDKRPELSQRPSADNDTVWQSLVPYKTGWVVIPDPGEYNLQPGVPFPELGGEGFSVSMYHQLHCLVFIRRFYWQLVDALEAGETDQARELVEKQVKHDHVYHCFSYLVQAIECSADLSMEWALVEASGERRQTDGWGIPHHQCKDPGAIRAWIDKVHA